jgi:hypothetical protein
VLLLERLERQILVDRQVALTGGAKKIPDVFEAVEDFDRRLLAEPKQITPERRVLLDALGVRHG